MTDLLVDISTLAIGVLAKALTEPTTFTHRLFSACRNRSQALIATVYVSSKVNEFTVDYSTVSTHY
jgi:hypothetical protein